MFISKANVYILTGIYILLQALNRNLTEMYSKLSNWTEEAIETMEIGGYYVMEIMSGLKVMAINSNYG